MFWNWSPGLVTGIATLSWIVLLVLLVGIELVSSSTRVTSVKSATRCWREKVRDNRTHRSDQGYLGPIKNLYPRFHSKSMRARSHLRINLYYRCSYFMRASSVLADFKIVILFKNREYVTLRLRKIKISVIFSHLFFCEFQKMRNLNFSGIENKNLWDFRILKK